MAIAFTMQVESAGVAGAGTGMGGPKKQLGCGAQASFWSPQSASELHAPMPSVPRLPFRHRMAGPAPSVQSAGPEPALPESVSATPEEIPVTASTDVEPSGIIDGGWPLVPAPA